ncbi:hypothetical protein LTR37_008153 [Vermiconidia calcicola]|uniref:Uncharacterized protein n=1 Tax=Vermiconidia calcicola TaxID=1690605 RepID=A0ACC3NBF1_9PEZI|nr:hypothetical protein LTR37_008153 [Vermiconidia calcicola]
MAHEDPTGLAYPLSDYNRIADEDDHHTLPLGIPTKKRRFEPVHIFTALLSWLCLMAAYITITTHLPLAWYLGFSGQIVVIGFLLGIMDLCTLTVVPYTFILLEARFGSSSLQNYEALLTSQVLSPGAKPIWRLALGFFVVLPFGLSVAYKRFLGGTSSAQITVNPPGQYGIDFPDISAWAPSGDAIYLLATSISPFLSASQYNPQPYPPVDAFPSPYGYNTLLLSGNAAALLDIRTKSYVKRAQASLSNTAGEEWYLNSTVDAYVAMQAIGSDSQSNDRTWFKAVNSSVNLWPAQGLSGAYLWEKPGVSIDFMPSEDNTQCFIGVYENSEVQEGFLTFSNPRYSEYASFRPYAQEFSI